MIKAVEEVYTQNSGRMGKSFYVVLKSGKAFLRRRHTWVKQGNTLILGQFRVCQRRMPVKFLRWYIVPFVKQKGPGWNVASKIEWYEREAADLSCKIIQCYFILKSGKSLKSLGQSVMI